MSALMVTTSDEGSGEMVEMDRRLWLTADRERVVEDGDPDAASLFATPGDQVPREQAERFGLVDQPKRARKTEDKQARRGSDKAAGDPGKE